MFYNLCIVLFVESKYIENEFVWFILCGEVYFIFVSDEVIDEVFDKSDKFDWKFLKKRKN